MKATIIRHIAMSALAFAFALLACDALAVVHVWTGGGGADNRWTTARNWDPESSDPRDVSFPAGQDWTVELAVNTNNWLFSIELPAGSGTVTLTGLGLLKPGSGAVVKVSAGRELKVDGATLNLDGVDTSENGFFNGTLRVVSGEVKTRTTAAEVKLPTVFGGTASLIVEGGTFGVTDGFVCLTNNATLTVLGGVAQAKRWSLCSPDAPIESITRVLLEGGTFKNCDESAYMTKLYEGARFVNRGGTLVWGQGTDGQFNVLSSATTAQAQGESFREFLPCAGGTLVLPTSMTTDTGALYFAVEGDYTVGGSIYVTNNVSAAAGNVNFYGTSVVLRGRPTICANAVNVSNHANCDYDLYLARLNLGIGGIRRTALDYGQQSLNFKDGIVFGAWGGNVMAEAPEGIERLSVNLERSVVYDTLDCFDETTPRTINMSRIKMDGVTDFKATGGGIVQLSVAALSDELRTVEVEDNTTLAFLGTKAGLKTMNLRLGTNATIKVDLSVGNYVDASATAEFGEGAEIVATSLPSPLVEGSFYPVYFAPVGTDPDLSKVACDSELPTGWLFAKAGNAVYLTDGKATPYSEARSGSTRIWSGAGSDNRYANTDNWISNEVAVASCHAFFKGNVNTMVSIDSALTLRNFNVSGGPFVFGGSGAVSFQYPQESSLGDLSIASVMNEGRFPVVVENLVGTATETNCLLFQAFNEGSVSLTGGSNQGCPFGFGGDVRLGGTWTVECLHIVPCYGAIKNVLRNSRLTVMPGAALTVTAQTGNFNLMGIGALAVATNATAVVGGTDFTLASERKHYVDGSLSVTCPLDPTARQTFLGDGTLRLSGGVADAPDGGVRLEGSITLVPVDWTNDVALSVRDSVTIAPSADWTFGGDATLSLDDWSTLTLATGGHKLTLAARLESEGSVVVTGGGTVVLATLGTRLGKLTCADGVKLEISKDVAVHGQYVDILAVREDDASIAFGQNLAVKKRFDDTTGCIVYSVKNTRVGLSIAVR